MFIQPFFVPGIAHSSYLIGSGKVCAVVDPERHVEDYLDRAERFGMKITHVLLTHLHADFAAGHLELTDRTGAEIVVPKAAGSAFPHSGVEQDDTFEIGKLRIRVLETPGHTPEHVSYAVADSSRGSEPWAVFCGDTLFVGDVGRPDLFPDRAEELASELFSSLRNQLMSLPDFCEVYPAHGAGSLCGRSLGKKRSSTIGYERRYNESCLIQDRWKFIESLTHDMPPAPDHFSRLSEVNAKGPALLRTLPDLERLNPHTFCEAVADERIVVVDVRDPGAFGAQHVPGAWHCDLTSNFSTFSGWVLPPEKKILVVAASENEARQAVRGLRRVGLDRVAGFLDGGLPAWALAGLPTGHVPQISAPELHSRLAGEEEMVLLDVRSPREFEIHHIDGAVNIPAPDLRTRADELDDDLPITLICSTGRRSSLAASLLVQREFEQILNVSGGMTGFSAAGFAPRCPVCTVPHGPRITEDWNPAEDLR